MSAIAPTAPPAAAPPAAPAAPAADEYSFEAELSKTLEEYGNDPSKALRGEAPPAAPAAPAKPEPPKPDDTVTPKPGEKPDDAPPDDDDGLLSSLLKGEEIKESALQKPGDAPTDPNSRAFKTWAELRGAYDLTSKEVAELKKQLAEAQTKVPKDYDDLKAQLAKKDEHIAQIDLFQTPDYQQQVAQPIAAYEQEFDKLAERVGVSKGLMREAILISDEGAREEAINRVLSESSKNVPVTTMTLAVMNANQYQGFLAAQKEYMANAPKMLALIRERQEAEKLKMTEKEREEYGRASNVAVQVIEKTLHFLLKGKDGKVDPEVINQIKADAGRDFNSLKPAQKAFALMAPTIIERSKAAFKAEAEKNKALSDEVAKLKLQLSKYSRGTPDTTPDSPAAASPGLLDGLDSYSGIQLAQLPVR